MSRIQTPNAQHAKTCVVGYSCQDPPEPNCTCSGCHTRQGVPPGGIAGWVSPPGLRSCEENAKVMTKTAGKKSNDAGLLPCIEGG